MKILLQPATAYHIYNHANGDENLFREEKNYHYFLKKYFEYTEPIAKTYAYCLMPNHFHFLIRIREEGWLLDFFEDRPSPGLKTSKETRLPYLLSQQFSHLFNAYTQALNKMYGRMGSLFMSNFKRKEVDNENYFTELVRYIHFNPVHHGFVDDPTSWDHSSVHQLCSNQLGKIAKEEIFEWFGGKEGFLKSHSMTPTYNFIKPDEFE